jgi:putative photosynthetic complex assembly protein 2
MALLPAAYALSAWLAGAALIALVERLSRPVFGWAMAGGTLLLVPALVALWAVRHDTSPAGAYVAFSCALVAWCWQELACAPYLGRRRCGFALETRLGHELAWLAFLAGAAALTWGGANLAARWALPALWALHLSLRVNELARVAAGAPGPLIRPPWFAPGLPAAQLLSMAFPLSITALTAALTIAVTEGGAAWLLLSGALAGGLAAHWSLVLRLPRWARLPRTASERPRRPLPAGEGVGG